MANDNPVTLIKAKIFQPPVRDDMVPRPRLIEQLNRGLDCPLTLICAGAGFGKTTLASAWLNELAASEQIPNAPLVTWLNLDEHESDLHLFLRYFITALRTVAPTAGAETLSLLDYRREPPPELLLATLSNDLFRLAGKTTIVLDDYHTIRGSAVHDLLTGLLQHWPPPLHLVLISRYTPPLPVAGLRARGDVVEIRNHDLRFSPDEVAEYVRLTWPVMLSRPELKMLEKKTEGWVAGMQLASLSLRVAGNVETVLKSLTVSNAEIAEYMANEVLARQPEPFHSFLLKSSILDRFNVSLCAAIEANEDPNWSVRAILDWLLHGNLFILTLDNDQNWYRFHALFRDFLHHRLLTRISQDEVGNLHRRAARWYAKEGLLDPAIDHALKAHDLDLAAELMEQGLVDVLNREDRQTLERWLKMLPEELIENRPGLLMIKAWSHHFSWQIDAVSRSIQKVEALLDQGENEGVSNGFQQVLLGQIADLKAQEAFLMGRPDQSIIYCWEAINLMPPSWTYVRGGVMLYLALSMQATGEGTVIEAKLIELYESLTIKTDGYALRLLMALCLIYTQSGQLERLAETARHLLKQSTQSRLVVLHGWAHFFLGLVHYQWNQLKVAGQHFDELIDLRFQIHLLTARQGMIGSALVHLAAGRDSEARNVVDQLSQTDLTYDGRLTNVTQSLRARVALASSNIEDAGRWADTFTVPAGRIEFVLLELPQLTRAQILATSSSWEHRVQAIRILEDLCAQAENTHNIRRKMEILAASAIALAAQGKIATAHEKLQKAVGLARSGGFVRVFVDLGPRMHEMLSTLDTHNSQADFRHRILAGFPKSRVQNLPYAGQHENPGATIHSSAEAIEMVEQLTRRETEVLTMLREPLSAKGIARKLDISHATVKRHTINLYGKLGVNSRWEAVAKAETLGILSPR